MKKSLLILFAAAAALVACNKEANVKDASSREIRFTTNLNTYTVKAAVEENVLENVKIIAGAPINKTVSATPTQTDLAGTLTTSPVLYWGVGQTESTKFVAITGGQENLVVNEYNMVSMGYDYAYCSKLMSAVATVAPENTVALNFEHIFSKVVINITNNLGSDEVASVAFNKVAAQAKIDFENRTFENLSEQTASLPANEITANQKYAVVIIPQTATPEIVVTTQKGAVYTFTVNAAFTFQRAKTATVALELNPSSSAGTRAQVGEMNFTVVDWAVDNTAMSGEGTLNQDAYWHIFGKVYTEADKTNKPGAWEKRYPLAFNVDGKWEITINYDPDMAHSDGGFLFVKGDTYLGMWEGSENISSNYDLKTSERANILTAEGKGKYRFVLDPETNNNLTYTRLGDCD